MPAHPQAYEECATGFRSENLAALLSGDLSRGLNICYECCDRHAEPDRVALLCESADGRSSVHTFAELSDLSAQFARSLRAQGVRPGERIACLLPRTPELVVTALGTWRAGAVYLPLFTAFGPKAIEYRLRRSGARLVVTDAANRPKLDGIEDLPTVLTVAGGEGRGSLEGDLDFWEEVLREETSFPPVMRASDDPFALLFTSGTTGQAKGVPVTAKALLHILAYMKYAVDLRPEDKFWNVADPGWAYGLFFSLIGPLLLGHPTLFYMGPFTAENAYRLLEKYEITNLAAAPTAYRLLMGAGAARKFDCRLRAASSAGEPLNPEVIRWFAKHTGCPVRDHYGQTELGMVVCNFHALEHPVRPGSMGRPVPGFRVVALDAEWREVAPGGHGQLAIDITASPLYAFPGYWEEGRDSPCFRGRYHLTGDIVEVGDDGCFTFMGRADDIILYAGYRIGPFDVESALLEHPAVAESAVVGKPDAERGEIVKAFVVLRPGHEPSADLATEIQQLVRERLSAHAYPREVEFVTELPKTPSGKIQRYLLRQRAAA